MPSQKSNGSDDERPKRAARNGDRRAGPVGEGVRLVLAALCLLVWLGESVYSTTAQVSTPVIAQAVPFLAATYLFGSAAWPKRRNGDDE